MRRQILPDLIKFHFIFVRYFKSSSIRSLEHILANIVDAPNAACIFYVEMSFKNLAQQWRVWNNQTVVDFSTFQIICMSSTLWHASTVQRVAVFVYLCVRNKFLWVTSFSLVVNHTWTVSIKRTTWSVYHLSCDYPEKIRVLGFVRYFRRYNFIDVISMDFLL